MPLLDVSPVQRSYETLPNLNDIAIPARAPALGTDTEDTQAVKERFGEAVLDSGLQFDLPFVVVQPDKLQEVATWLRDGELAFHTLIDVTAVDLSRLPAGEEENQFQTVYQFRAYERHRQLAVVCPLNGGRNPVCPSLASIFPGAIWPEREVIDLMGVAFEGHPDPRRILNAGQLAESSLA